MKEDILQKLSCLAFRLLSSTKR